MLTVWTFDPVPLAAIAVAALAYVRRLYTLRRRGVQVERWRCAAFSLSLLALVLAVASPIDAIGEERLFSVHMLQHLLIGDVAPLLAVLGLSGPLLPHTLRLGVLAQPLVSLPLWATNLYVWHAPLLYDATLEHPLLHSAEHALFYAGGFLLWATILDLLARPRWYGPAERLASLATVWVVGGVLANVFLWSGRAFYAPYRNGPELWGLTPVADQRLGGGLMMLEMTAVVVPVALLITLRWLRESERRQLEVDAGWETRRAVGYRVDP